MGGAVRDMLCGRVPHDYDWAFAGTPEDFLQGNPSARKIIPDKNVFWLNGFEYAQLADSLDEDLRRRDFTINALASDRYGRLYAHPQAFADISGRVLRPVSPTALRDDPIRVFRAARLAAQLPDHAVHPDTINQMQAAAPLLSGIAAEQVGRELWKALESERPSRFFQLLNDASCLLPWFTELENAADITAGPPPWHTGPVLDHLLRVIDSTARQTLTPDRPPPPFLSASAVSNPLVNWMALCHDLGKLTTDPAILPHHYAHEARGLELALALGERLRLPRRAIAAGAAASRLHMKAARYFSLRPGTRVDLLMELHNRDLLRELFTVAFADACSLNVAGIPSENLLLVAAENDLQRILKVRLPEELRNKGEKSGKCLRELRCRVLSLNPPLNERAAV